MLGLGATGQFAIGEVETVAFGWFTALSNFNGKTRQKLYPSRFQFFAIDPNISPVEDLIEWYAPLSVPKRPKLGGRSYSQQFFASRQLNFITATLATIETKDVFAGTLYSASSLSGAIVSIIEIAPIYGNVSTLYPATVFANVSIIEIEV